MPTVFSDFSSENPSFSLGDDRLVAAVFEHDAIIGGCSFDRDIALAHVFGDFVDRPAERIAEPAATRAGDSDYVILAEPVVAKPRGKAFFVRGGEIDQAGPVSPGVPGVNAEGRDGVLVGTHGEADVIG